MNIKSTVKAYAARLDGRARAAVVAAAAVAGGALLAGPVPACDVGVEVRVGLAGQRSRTGATAVVGPRAAVGAVALELRCAVRRVEPGVAVLAWVRVEVG